MYAIINYLIYMAIDAPQFTDCFNSTATQEFIMFYYTASLQFAQKTATAFDFACAIMDRLYWLDDNYVQPFTLGLGRASVTWLSVASAGQRSHSSRLPSG
jgi:hypothetical protein